MVCLSVTGGILAGAHYAIVDLPAQAGLHAPHNALAPLPETCTRENMDRCETGCTRSSGVLDLNCYEACIYSIC
jgi:hypothetical protein